MDKNEQIKAYRQSYSKLVAACWQDGDLKKNFINNPKDILKEYSVPVEESKQYQVIEADKYSAYVVLPYEGTEEAIQSLFKLFHLWSDKGSQIIQKGCELRIIQNTADINYLVLPPCPDLYTENEKMELRLTNGYTVTDVDVAVQLEVAVQAVCAQTAAVVTTAAAEAEVAAIVFGFIVLI